MPGGILAKWFSMTNFISFALHNPTFICKTPGQLFLNDFKKVIEPKHRPPLKCLSKQNIDMLPFLILVHVLD